MGEHNDTGCVGGTALIQLRRFCPQCNGNGVVLDIDCLAGAIATELSSSQRQDVDEHGQADDRIQRVKGELFSRRTGETVVAFNCPGIRLGHAFLLIEFENTSALCIRQATDSAENIQILFGHFQQIKGGISQGQSTSALTNSLGQIIVTFLASIR